MTKDKFVLYSDCIPVKGVRRSLICDMQNNNYHFIPNSLVDILEKYAGKTMNFIKEQFNNEYDEVIDDYFNFLYSNNLIFFSSKPELFPKMSLKWESPSIITNTIIDFDNKQHDFNSIISQLEILKCSYVQLRFFQVYSIEFINDLAQMLEISKSRIVSIDFILPFDNSLSTDQWNNILTHNPRIHSIIIYNSPDDISYNPLREKMGYLMYVKKNIINEKHCGIINQEYFYSNIKLFSESQKHNTCLNRKIAIDREGNIKNCPSMLKSFGNIDNTTLSDAIDTPTFKKYWSISKDQIEVCKDCEFRHICTDCRAYLENPDDLYSKPLKCGYNPYTNEWEEWSSNSCKQTAIKTYVMLDLIKKND